MSRKAKCESDFLCFLFLLTPRSLHGKAQRRCVRSLVDVNETCPSCCSSSSSQLTPSRNSEDITTVQGFVHGPDVPDKRQLHSFYQATSRSIFYFFYFFQEIEEKKAKSQTNDRKCREGMHTCCCYCLLTPAIIGGTSTADLFEGQPLSVRYFSDDKISSKHELGGSLRGDFLSYTHSQTKFIAGDETCPREEK